MLAGLSITDQKQGDNRIGNYVLEKMRSEIPKNQYAKLALNFENLQMSLMNDYLNGYSEKLACNDPDKPREIIIDQDAFMKIVNEVSADTYNPYTIYTKEKKETEK